MPLTSSETWRSCSSSSDEGAEGLAKSQKTLANASTCLLQLARFVRHLDESDEEVADEDGGVAHALDTISSLKTGGLVSSSDSLTLSLSPGGQAVEIAEVAGEVGSSSLEGPSEEPSPPAPDQESPEAVGTEEVDGEVAGEVVGTPEGPSEEPSPPAPDQESPEAVGTEDVDGEVAGEVVGTPEGPSEEPSPPAPDQESPEAVGTEEVDGEVAGEVVGTSEGPSEEPSPPAPDQESPEAVGTEEVDGEVAGEVVGISEGPSEEPSPPAPDQENPEELRVKPLDPRMASAEVTMLQMLQLLREALASPPETPRSPKVAAPLPET